MKLYFRVLILVVSCVLFLSLHAAAQAPRPYVGSPAFEKMKQLVGSWEGTMDMGRGPETVMASYKLTSGGSAIIETIFQGVPQEMVTVFHDNPKKQLMMTHYCSLGNQPIMSLKSMDHNMLKFELVHDSGINVDQEKHMHAAAISIEGNNTMVQHWTKYEGGKSGGVVKVVYARVR